LRDQRASIHGNGRPATMVPVRSGSRAAIAGVAATRRHDSDLTIERLADRSGELAHLLSTMTAARDAITTAARRFALAPYRAASGEST